MNGVEVTLTETECSWAMSTELGTTPLSDVSSHVYLEHGNKALVESGHGDRAGRLWGLWAGTEFRFKLLQL